MVLLRANTHDDDDEELGIGDGWVESRLSSVSPTSLSKYFVDHFPRRVVFVIGMSGGKLA